MYIISWEKMRIFLTVFSFINIILYYAAFAYFDNILDAFAGYNITAGYLSFLRYFIVFIIGFMIGLLIILTMKPKAKMNYFDIKVFLIVGFIPALALILNGTGAVNLIVTKFFGPDLTVSDLFYYFFSNNIVWSLWLGISMGASIRLRFAAGEKRFKHEAKHKAGKPSTAGIENLDLHPYWKN